MKLIDILIENYTEQFIATWKKLVDNNKLESARKLSINFFRQFIGEKLATGNIKRIELGLQSGTILRILVNPDNDMSNVIEHKYYLSKDKFIPDGLITKNDLRLIYTIINRINPNSKYKI